MINFLSENLSDRSRYLILLIGVILLFIFAFTPNSLVYILLKIIAFAVFISFFYVQFWMKTIEEPDEEEELPELDEQSQDWLKIESDEDIEAVFNKFLNVVLNLVQKVLVSDTAILLFANYSKKIFTIRHKITKNPDLFISGNSFDILKSLPSLILTNRTPLIENNLPEGQKILPYYKAENANPPKSFAGVPVAFNDYVVGVLAVDTAVEEAYSNEDLEILKYFSSLISTQLVNSNKLYEYETENWVTNTLYDVSQGMTDIFDLQELWKYFSLKIPKIMACNRLSISLKINQEQGQISWIDGGIGNLKNGKTFPLTQGIVGWVMRKNQSLKVDDFSSKENYVPRFLTDESPAENYFSLLAVPISRNKEVLGAICIESDEPRSFKEQDKRILQTVTNQLASILLTIKTMEHLKKYSFADIKTSQKNLNAFKSIIPREVSLSKLHKLNLNLLFLKVDVKAKEDLVQYFDEAIEEFISLLLPQLSYTDYIFRLDNNLFAAAAIRPQLNDIKHLADSVVQKIMQQKIWASGNVRELNLNVGIVPNEYLTENIDEIIKKGNISLNMASAQGTNSIALFKTISTN